MSSKQAVKSIGGGASGLRLQKLVLNMALPLMAGAPVLGFAQASVAPAVVEASPAAASAQAPAVGVVAQAPAVAAASTPQPVLAPPVPQPAAAPTLITARVLSVTSVAQPASATRLVCTDVAEVPAPTTGAGAVAGALVGAAVGSQVGGGTGNALATAAGFVGGALMGDKAEQGGRTQAVRQCVTHSGVGPSVAYQVTYEFGGQQYSTMLPYHPGATLQVQVSPVVAGVGGGVGSAAPALPPGTVASPGAPALEGTVAVAPPMPAAVAHTVVVAAPAYGYYGPYGYSAYAPYWGAPVVVGVGVGRYWGGRPYRGWHGHRRW